MSATSIKEMTLEQLYNNSLGNTNNIRTLIELEYREYIKNQFVRLIGFYSFEYVDMVIERMCLQLPKFNGNCDLMFLAFDCVRHEILELKNESIGSNSITFCSIIENYRPILRSFSEIENDSKRLDIVLSFLSGKKREYFFDRYYFFKDDVSFNRKYEKEIKRLFAGKGIVSLRFKYFNIVKKSVTPSLYLDCLSTLDPFYISRLDVIQSDAKFLKSSNLSFSLIYAERKMIQAKWYLYTIPFVFAGIGIILLYFALN